MHLLRGGVFVGCAVLILAGCPFGGPNGDDLSYSVEITGFTSVDPKGDSLNDFDTVAGAAFPPIPSNINPAVWQNGELHFIQHAFDFGFLHGVNNRGAVVGTELFQGPGTFFHFVSFIDAQAPPSRTDVSGQIYSVNEFNEYVGTADNIAVLGLVHSDRLTLFEGEDGDLAAAYDINDWGDFVGSTNNTTAGAQLAVKWLRGERMLLDSLGGPFSEAYAINNHGIAVGASTNPPAVKNGDSNKAVCWMGTGVIKLPTLGGTASTAWDINDHGEAVGFSMNESEESRAVLWRTIGDGTPAVIDLNDVTDFGEHAGSLVLREAIDINEPGAILCRADQADGETIQTVFVLLRA